MKIDPIVEEVRRIRDELARRFNYDVRAIGRDLMARQGHTLTPDELEAIRSRPASAGMPLVVREKPDTEYKTP
jgi:hypothetical protein